MFVVFQSVPEPTDGDSDPVMTGRNTDSGCRLPPPSAVDFVPFGTGPKGCVGQFLAMVEMKAVLAEMLRQYSVFGDATAPTLEAMYTRWDIANQPTETTSMRIAPRRRRVDGFRQSARPQ